MSTNCQFVGQKTSDRTVDHGASPLFWPEISNVTAEM
jgi:hypothetical protein